MTDGRLPIGRLLKGRRHGHSIRELRHDASRPRAARTEWRVFDLEGRRVRTLELPRLGPVWSGFQPSAGAEETETFYSLSGLAEPWFQPHLAGWRSEYGTAGDAVVAWTDQLRFLMRVLGEKGWQPASVW